MQNSIIREFAGNPRVVAACFQEGGRHGETAAWARTYWTNHYLRDFTIWDPDGRAGSRYRMPGTGLPFGRGFLIDPEGRVALSYFGHQPERAIAGIYELIDYRGCDPPMPRGGFAIKESPAHDLVYTDGYRTRLDLRYPDPTAAVPPAPGWPGLLLVYGLGGSRQGLAAQARSHARRGYLVLTYDVRGQGEAISLNPGGGGTLIGDREKCDMARVFHRAEEIAGGLLDFHRLAVSGGSQGGLHAWAAAAWSGRLLPRARGEIIRFPRIRAALPVAATAGLGEAAEPRGCAFGNRTVDKFFGSGASFRLDPAFLQAGRDLFLRQDFPGWSSLVQPWRRDAQWIVESAVPLFAANSYDDHTFAVGDMVAACNALPATTPRLAYLTTGHHGSPRNTLEARQLTDLQERWLDRFMKGVPDDLADQPPFLLALTPNEATAYTAPATIWQNRRAAGLPSPAATPQVLFLRRDGRLDPAPPAAVEPADRVSHQVAPGFGPAAYTGVYHDPAKVFLQVPLASVLYRGAPLPGSRELQGSAQVDLHIISTAKNLQVGVALLDEDPQGGKRWVTGGFTCFRGRPGGASTCRVRLDPAAYVFPAGHRIDLALENHAWIRPPGRSALRVVPYFESYTFDIEHRPGRASALNLPLLPRVGLGCRVLDFQLSQAAGGRIDLALDGSPHRAAAPYLALISLSGTVPGISLPGLHLPINYDPLTELGLLTANSHLFPGFLGTLDGRGRARPAFAPGPGDLGPEWIGVRFSFTALALAGTGPVAGPAAQVSVGY